MSALAEILIKDYCRRMAVPTHQVRGGRAGVAALAAASLLAVAPPATAAAGTATSPPAGTAATQVNSAATRPSKSPLGSIAAPADQAVRDRAAGPVTVRLRLADGARLTALRVNGRDVMDRAKVRGRTATVRLGSGQLKAGRNGVLARFVRDHRQTLASSRFTVVRSAPGLMRLSIPHRSRRASGEVSQARVIRRPAGPVPIEVRTTQPATLTAWLNGRRYTGRFTVQPDGTRRTQLGPGAGLRYGDNAVRVRALTPAGRAQETTVVVRVGRNGPLADAGKDRRTDTRHAIRLDGRKTRPNPSAAAVTYAWRLTRSPANASATLSRRHSARPRFASNRPGTYVLTNTAKSGGATSSDQVTVTVAPSALVQPVAMTVGPQSSGGPGPGIAVGSAFYPSGATGPGLQLVVLERATLALSSNRSYAPDQMQALQQFLVNATEQANSSDYLFVLAALPGGAPVAPSGLTQLVVAVQQLGFHLPDPADPDSAIDPSQSFALVGIPDPDNDYEGTAWWSQTALNGVFTPDVNNNWTFNTNDYQPFNTGDTSVGGQQITLGDTSWPTPAVSTGGGFQVVVADPITLQGSSSYFALPVQVQNMAQVMQQAVTDQQVVALRSVGTLPDLSQPTTQSDANAFTQVSAAIQALGGSPSVLMGLGPGDSYALVGPTPPGSFPAEGSSTIPGGTGSVTGLLARTPQGGGYAPMAADPTGAADFATTVSSVALQPAQPWPVSSTPGQVNALAALSEALGLGCTTTPCDVRTQYENLDYAGTWTARATTVKAEKYPCTAKKPCDYSPRDFDQVKGQLATEFPMVDNVWKLVNNIQQVYVDTQGSTSTGLQQAVNAVDLAVTPPDNEATTTILSLVTDVMWATSLIDVEDFAVFATVAGVLAVGAASGNDLANLPSGSPYQAVADAGPVFTNDIVDQMAATMLGVGLLGSFVVQDWGRLSTVSSQAGGPWFISNSTFDALSDGAIAGATQNMYSALLPVAYDAYSFTPPPGQGQNIGQCQPAWWNDALPWSKAAGTASYLNTVAPPVTGVEPDAGMNWYALWEAGKSPTHWSGPSGGPPPASLMDPLYQPFSFQNLQNAGLYAPWFWGRTYLSAQDPAPTVLKCTYRD